MEKTKILVVDNHPIMLKFMGQLLMAKGHDVVLAKDGLTAIEILKSFVPDVAFVDLVMPNVSGERLCQIMRRAPQLRDMTIIILSAVAAEENVDISRLEADFCIAKGPFNQMERNIIAVLARIDSGSPNESPDRIIGFEQLHLREVSRELLSVKRHLETILMSMAEGVLEIDQDGRIIYANPSAQDVTSLQEEEILGKTLAELFNPETRERLPDLLGRPKSALQETLRAPCILTNGKQTSLNASTLRGGSGETIVVINDISKQRRMEFQFHEAQKMEALGTLAGGIAHDFNNLLMTIQGNASLMLFDLDSSHPHYHRLRAIEEQVESGAQLSSQLLGYARRGGREVSVIDLNELLEETAGTFGRTKKQITIQKAFAPDLLPLALDRSQMEQVLLNLYINAADAMPNGGQLSITTRNSTSGELKDKLFDSILTHPDNYVVLTIADTGCGMDEATQQRIFEPFFTTKGKGKGTGLGLASAYGIIKSHNGFIEVLSSPGKGSTFTIYLPASSSDELKKPTKKETGEILKGDETILLVDDEQMILDVGAQLLMAMGYSVFKADNGDDALDIYQRERIDLVVLDIVMPGMNGSEVFDRLRQISPEAKVLLSSGYSINDQASDILKRGCNGFIQKPFDLIALSRRIREILDAHPRS